MQAAFEAQNSSDTGILSVCDEIAQAISSSQVFFPRESFSH
jgi:hypothetical protein